MATGGKPVYSDGKVHVMAERCSTCVFRPGNLMGLRAGRLKGMVEESIADGAGITCHKTLYGQADQEATCKGFLETYGDQVLTFRLAAALGILVEPCPECEGTGLIEMVLGPERCNDCVEGWVNIRG